MTVTLFIIFVNSLYIVLLQMIVFRWRYSWNEVIHFVVCIEGIAHPKLKLSSFTHPRDFPHPHDFKMMDGLTSYTNYQESLRWFVMTYELWTLKMYMALCEELTQIEVVFLLQSSCCTHIKHNYWFSECSFISLM